MIDFTIGHLTFFIMLSKQTDDIQTAATGSDKTLSKLVTSGLKLHAMSEVRKLINKLYPSKNISTPDKVANLTEYDISTIQDTMINWSLSLD